jgi:peroxiredoxin
MSVGQIYKALTCILLIAVLCFSCGESASYSVKGSIDGLENTELYVVADLDSVARFDTVAVKNGRFKFSLSSDSLCKSIIYKKNGNLVTFFWAKNGDKISVEGNISEPEKIIVRGNDANDLMTRFKLGNDSPAEFVRANPSSVVSLELIQSFLLDSDSIDSVQSLLDDISGEARSSAVFAKIQRWILQLRRTEIGRLAPQFSIISTARDTITLETFSDRYLLLNFTASWCPACESDIAAWKAISRKFSRNRLEILTVVLDEDRVAWEIFAREKSIAWPQVIDNAGWASTMVSLYNVSEIPCNYIIDRQGIIIASKILSDSIMPFLVREMQ